MARSFSELPRPDLSDLTIFSADCSMRIARAALEHGPIFRWSAREGPEAGEDRVSMVGPEANRFVLHTHRDHFSNAQGWMPILGSVIGLGLLSQDEPDHALHRRIWNPAFTRASLSAYVPLVHQVVEDQLRTWPDDGVIDIFREARKFTFDITARVLAGMNAGSRLERLREHFNTVLYGHDERNEAAEAFAERTRLAQIEMLTLLLAEVRARRSAPPSGRPDVLALLLQARNEQDKPLADKQVLDHLKTLIAAGHETTTSLAAWIFHLLAGMPAHRLRLEEELEAVLGKNGPADLEALARLSVMENFIKETGRLYSPGANMPRGVVKPFEFEGYEVPAGVQLRLGIGACHRLPSVFEDPDAFDPDRFEPPREEDKRRPYALVTFSAGQRACIGRDVVFLELKALLTHALRRFTLEPVPGERPVLRGLYTTTIPGGLRLKVRRKAGGA